MLSRHIRSNIVGYVALFIALSGSAAALQGKNSVKAKDIAKGAVTTPKIRNGAVTSQQLGAGAVGASDIAAGAVGTAALANGAVMGANIAGTTITGAQLDKPTLDLGPSSLGTMPALRVPGVLAQTAPAIAPTAVQLDTGNVILNKGGFGVSATGATVPIGGVYYVRLMVPWGDDPDDADRQFVAILEAEGGLVQTASARATQDVGFNYGPSTEAAGLAELQAGDELTGEVYYSGTTPTGEISLAGLGPTILEAFWLGPG
jgi:hypothetical protein